MYRVSAGLDTYEEAPGYKKIRIMPHPTDSLDYVYADLDTYYGKASSHWKRENGRLSLDVVIPPNTTAEATASITAISRHRASPHSSRSPPRRVE